MSDSRPYNHGHRKRPGGRARPADPAGRNQGGTRGDFRKLRGARLQSGISGIGLLVFALLVIASLYLILRPGAHPVALERNVPLCEVLGSQAWTALVPADIAATAKREVVENPSVCIVERQGPATTAASAEPHILARLMLTTEADIRHGNPGQSFGRYINTFVEEMTASGWTPVAVDGPWRRTYAFTGLSGETVLLIDDEGVFLWISSKQFPAERLAAYANTITGLLRSVKLRDRNAGDTG